MNLNNLMNFVNNMAYETTPPYSPESNGVAERKNRTLKNMMNAMLISSGAPLNLWGEAILSACHIQNRIPYKKTGITPYEIWKGHAPNLNYLKVWGCPAKILLPEPKRKKLGPKTFDCMFIGYAHHSASYRFLVTRSDNNVMEINTIVETKNAEFFEHIFPLKTHVDKPSHASSSSHAQESDDNEEIELRRSKRVRKETDFGKDFFTFLVGDDPLTYKEAISSPDAPFWKEAINNELESILPNHTWELVDLSPDAKPISCK